MALIECPECGHQVSDQAETCPSCGRRLNDRLAKLELENELNRIDREWEEVKKKRERSIVPSREKFKARVAIATTFVVVALGFVIARLPERAREEFAYFVVLPLVGLYLLFLIGSAIIVFAKAADYEEAEIEYRQKREAAKAKYEAEEQAQAEEPSP